MGIFLSLDFLKIFLPVLIAVLGWFLNEHSKRGHEKYVRREDRYVELVTSTKGFLAKLGEDDEENRKAKQTFLDQLNLSWLYCPDEVIRKGYAFLGTVKTGVKSTSEEKHHCLGEFVLAILKDLFSQVWFRRTRLTAKEFELLSPD